MVTATSNAATTHFAATTVLQLKLSQCVARQAHDPHLDRDCLNVGFDITDVVDLLLNIHTI